MSESGTGISGGVLLAAWLVLLAVIALKWVVPVFGHLLMGLGVVVPRFYVRLFGPLLGAIIFLSTPVLLILFLALLTAAVRRRPGT